jgi:hypothetical protein
MNWYKIETDRAKDGAYNYIGSSSDSLKVILKKAYDGEYIQLANLVYMDRGEIKKWSDWDKKIVPTIFINPKGIISIMQFKGDPKKK